jgi:hypothetical protein
MTEPTILALAIAVIAGIPPTMMAWAALAQGRRNNEKAKENLQKSDVIIEKAVEIHSLTNSRLSQVTADLKVANEKISGLEGLVSEMVQAKHDAKFLAQQNKIESDKGPI